MYNYALNSDTSDKSLVNVMRMILKSDVEIFDFNGCQDRILKYISKQAIYQQHIALVKSRKFNITHVAHSSIHNQQPLNQAIV